MSSPFSPTRTGKPGKTGELLRVPGMARLEDEMRVTAAELIDKVAEARLKVSAARYKIEDEVRGTTDKLAAGMRSATAKAKLRLGDDAKFFVRWIDSPLKTGSVTPSSPALAREMASHVDAGLSGPVIEIGPGTGPVTEALIAHGIAEERLILVEFSPEFCTLLRERFPKATVVEGDAYGLQATLSGLLTTPAIAVVSSLPLFTRPPPERIALVEQAFGMMLPGSPFIQFTYSVVSPVPRKGMNLKATVSDWVLRNIPPARVWTYRR
ncbi:MAG: class I SAM-dependent methyltransferase [Bosea sp. (in: a-proteobacteria)]